MFARYNEMRRAQVDGAEAGFTLIELLIVIVVLAILAAIVIFGLSGLTGQSAQAACNADAKTTEIAVEAYHAQTGNWPTTFTVLTTPNGNGVRYLRTVPNNPQHYFITLDAANNGVVDVQPSNKAATPAATGTPTDYDSTPNPCNATTIS
jgi:prepilin-type N-terminal cleavage/methylation domain-containing protein